MVKWLFAFSLCAGVLDEYLYNNQLEKFIFNKNQDLWHWAVWLVIFLIYIIGEKILKQLDALNKRVSRLGILIEDEVSDSESLYQPKPPLSDAELFSNEGEDSSFLNWKNCILGVIIVFLITLLILFLI